MQMWKRILCLLTISVLCISLTACPNRSEHGTSSPAATENGLVTYRVTVHAQGGKPLEKVGVRVFANTQLTEPIWYDKTDADGSMTFVAAAYDGYVLTLEDLPEEYDAQAYYPVTGELSEIVLSIGLQQDDLSGLRLSPGDAMHELTVTDTQGEEYVLSRLLTAHKAVALYFFDDPADAGLACLAQAREAYAQEIAVLALDPRGTAAASAQAELPLAVCDSGWLDALQLTQLPTLLMVDRFGMIGLCYADAIADEQVYRDIFAFYARNDYTAEVVRDVQSIIGKSLQGTQENPYTADGSQDIVISLAPGEKAYYNIYRAVGQYLTVQSSRARVWLAGQLYTPEDGVITMPVDTPDPFTPVLLCIENTGADTELFAARFSYRPGTQGNPLTLETGAFTVTLPESAADGENTVYYMYKAERPGVLCLHCPEQTEPSLWLCRLTNRNTGVQLYSQEDMLVGEDGQTRFLQIEVSANDVLLLEAAMLPDAETAVCPAGSFAFSLSYADGQSVLPTEPVGTEADFTVTARDQYGIALPGVTVTFIDSTGETVLVTDADGTVFYTAPFGEADILLTPPQGYTVPRTQLHLTADRNNVMLTFTGSMDAVPIELPLGTGYTVSEGEQYVILNAAAVTWFLFTPERAGVYAISAPGTLSFWGTDPDAMAEQNERLTPTRSGMTLTVAPEETGNTFLLGVSGAPCGTLSLCYLGEAEAPAPQEPTAPEPPTA